MQTSSSQPRTTFFLWEEDLHRCSRKEGKLGQFKFNVVSVNGLVNSTEHDLRSAAIWNDS